MNDKDRKVPRNPPPNSEKTVQMQHRRESEAENPLGPATEIGARLRALFSFIEEQEIPDQFLDLLEKLDAAEQSKSGKRNS